MFSELAISNRRELFFLLSQLFLVDLPPLLASRSTAFTTIASIFDQQQPSVEFETNDKLKQRLCGNDERQCESQTLVRLLRLGLPPTRGVLSKTGPRSLFRCPAKTQNHGPACTPIGRPGSERNGGRYRGGSTHV